jgi:peptidylprolyl isomerase
LQDAGTDGISEGRTMEAKRGDTVRVHYTGRLDDGSVFDSSKEREPLEFQLGSGQVIPGFDDAVAGMKPGEERSVTIAAAEAYGPRREELVISVARSDLPAGMEPGIGQQLEVSQNGQSFVVTVTDIDEEGIVLDANHPLAGEDLTFDLELVDIG